MPFVEHTDLTQFWRQEHGSTAPFFPFLLPNLKESSPVTSTFQVLPCPLRPRRLLFGLWLEMFNSLLSCLLLCSQYCSTYKKKNHQVLVEWILIALPTSHFNPTAVEVSESNLFVFIFRFWAYLSIHINVTSCHEATNIPHQRAHGSMHSSPLCPCLFGALCLGKAWLSLALPHVPGAISKSSSKMTFFGEATLSST